MAFSQPTPPFSNSRMFERCDSAHKVYPPPCMPTPGFSPFELPLPHGPLTSTNRSAFRVSSSISPKFSPSFLGPSPPTALFGICHSNFDRLLDFLSFFLPFFLHAPIHPVPVELFAFSPCQPCFLSFVFPRFPSEFLFRSFASSNPAPNMV